MITERPADVARQRDLHEASVALALPCVKNALACLRAGSRGAEIERELRDAIHHLTVGLE